MKNWIIVCYNIHCTYFWERDLISSGWTSNAMNATLYSSRRFARNALLSMKERKQTPSGMRCAVRPVCEASNEKASS
jgi:hypothetical protein